MTNRITYLDLFSGAGGFAKGLLQAGLVFEKHYFSEIDPYAIANYSYNFKQAIYVGEINKIKLSTIKRPDIITFGFPCQDISIAGKGKGLDGKRSKLYFKAIEIVERLKPRYFIVENVRNLFSSNQGKDFNAVLQAIAEIGLYDCQWQLLNSSCVLPQNRERIYFVGHLAKASSPQIFPLEVAYSAHETKIERGIKRIRKIGQAYLSKQSGRVFSDKGIAPTLVKDVSTTGFVQIKNDYRKLTPVEAERAQGFPDDWTKFGFFNSVKKKLSDTQRYALMGNAVSVPLVKQIGLKLPLVKTTFRNEVLNGLSIKSSQGMGLQKHFIEFVYGTLSAKEKPTRPQLEKKGRELGITNKREIKELTELAVLLYAREIIKGKSQKDAFKLLVNLYNTQPNSSYRSSTVALLRQYSTPLPISYLLGQFVNGNNSNYSYLEPSAGNGLLTIGLPPQQTHVNEFDSLRIQSLQKGGFKRVTQEDAFDQIKGALHNYDGVIANPPFGRLDSEYHWQGAPIYFTDHVMMLRALEAMKDNGRAAFITGKHMRFDSQGRITRNHGRAFFSILFSQYNVVDLIPIDGNSLYARQGTGFDTMLILVDGRKVAPIGQAPTKSVFNSHVIKDFEQLYDRISKHFDMTPNYDHLNQIAQRIKAKLDESTELGAPYNPTSEGCVVLHTEVPDNMAYEIHESLAKIKEKVGGNIDNFVRHRLGYQSKIELCKSLSAEQTDAVAMAIYNIEAKGQGCIIGDQTGIGKGRIAASLIRYAVEQGYTPIFLTEKPNLFSDLYRDLLAIGAGHYKPFIINARETKTNIKNPDGKIIYTAPTKSEQHRVYESRDLDEYDLVLATYSQFNAALKNQKKTFLENIAKDNIVIMDESHNASGKHSNTGYFFQGVVRGTRSTVFLSATFAKQPANMPLYALKTAISDANMTPETLTYAIERGGIALQEIIASQLVAEGQMIRRERSYEGIDIEYKIFEEKKAEHFAMADNITQIMRDIIAFQNEHIKPLIKARDKELAALNKEVKARGNTANLGISNTPYFSKIFNVINQMLLAINAKDVADLAIKALKAGKKAIVTIASTMESFLNQLIEEMGISPGDKQAINTDFALILKNGLDGIMRYTEVDEYEVKSFGRYELHDLPIHAQAEYLRILGHIEDATTGLQLSPIDIILDRIRKAGFSIHEVTGRSLEVKYNSDYTGGKVVRRKKINVNDAYAAFNNNEVDALIINQSGGTGASGHAIPTAKVSQANVRPRIMINAQPELDINKVVQLLGRIHRTGQIHLPSFQFAMSAIPAQSRLMSMMMIKLKSLNANTSSNQNRDKEMMNFPDFINKYGDRVVRDYLFENSALNYALGEPSMDGSNGEVANRVAGRVAILSTKDQEEFYSNIVKRYDEYVDILKQTGEYDLEMEDLPLEAVTLTKKIHVLGRGGLSRFGSDTFTEKLEVNALKKPFTVVELEQQIDQNLRGRSPQEYADALIETFDLHSRSNYERDKDIIELKYEKLLSELKVKPSLWKIHEKQGEAAFEQAYQAAESALVSERDLKLRGIETKFNGQKQRFYGLVKFFKVGRPLKFLQASYSAPAFATFLGFDINEGIANPYAPSAIKLKFAIASSQKYLVYPASYEMEVNSIRGASLDIREMSIPQLLVEWEKQIKDQLQDRVIRFMRTGNILQGATGGKLVSYTTREGKVKKGVLLPENTQFKDFDTAGIVIPLNRAHQYVLSRPIGQSAVLSNELSIINRGGSYTFFIPASANRGGRFFMDEKLISLTEDGKFEKIGSTMRGNIEGFRMKAFLDRLDEMSVNIELKQHEFDALSEEAISKTGKVKAIIPPPKEGVRAINFNELDLLKLKMKMKLKLKGVV